MCMCLGVGLINLRWNPQDPSLFGTLLTNGTCIVWQIASKIVIKSSLSTSFGATSSK